MSQLFHATHMSKLRSELPKLYASTTYTNKRVVNALKIPFTYYSPLTNNHIQTIAGVWSTPRTVEYLHHKLIGKDSGEVIVSEAKETTNGLANLLIFPGLTGTSNSRYIRQLVTHALCEGYGVYVFNYRGFVSPLKTPRVTCGIDVSDLRLATDFVKCRHPEKPLFLVGISMGANMMVKMLGIV